MERIKEYFKIALRNLITRKLRSWLTIMGVVIGIFLIVSLLSLSEGLKGAVMQQLKMMGKDLIMVVPGELDNMITSVAGGAELSKEDIKTIKKTKGVDFVIPLTYKAEVMRYQGEKKTILLYGNDWEKAMDVYKNDMGWSVKKGRWPVPGKTEIIVGSLVPEEIFPGLKVGTSAVIKGRKFEIVGILNSLGNKQDDSMIGLDINLFRAVTGEKEGAKMAFVKVKQGFLTNKAVENIKNKLEESKKRKRGKDDSSFTVLSSEKVSNIVGDIMGLIQAVIIGFASIAIVVGGIGTMNTMYTSVRERVKEIGIMKAIGAKRSSITAIFLIESGIFGLVGGIGGTLLGLIFAKIIELYFQFHPFLYLEASVTPGLIIFSLAFSFLVGCISGFLPARTAAKMKPVDALRYE